jgi:hypothetical protein
MSQVDIRLSDRADAFGFYYGEAQFGDAVVRVNVLPPTHLWAGDTMLEGHKADPTHWQVFANGKLIARVERQDDVGPALVPLLTGPLG